MSDVTIHVHDLGKRYYIDQYEAYQTIYDTFTKMSKRYVLRLIKRINPMNVREELWAVRHVSFDVKEGEVFGIIGENGAGKSTILKMMSRVTIPTEGFIDISGRVGSLLEVGTGFHPELTGDENIFLYGRIIGMSRKEIREKYDEIVKFSELEKFLNTPVKRYSSGMWVRLAFSVAAVMEPDIFIIDEALAVGDQKFQKKCLDRIRRISQSGNTIIFVSHNLSSVKEFCDTVMWIDHGLTKVIGETEEVIEQYVTK